jgi:Flp pilus assembly protein TadB
MSAANVVSPPYAGTILAIIAAAGCGLIVLLLCGPRREPVDTVQLLRTAEAQLLFGRRPPRPRLGVRLRRVARRRLDAAGLDDWPFSHLALISLATALLTGALALALLGAPPFGALGVLVGGALPWLLLGRQAERRGARLARQVAHMLSVTAGAAAAAIPPERIVTEVLPAALEPPVADTLARALRPLDPVHGVAMVSFADVMIDFDRRLGSDAFSLARLAIEDTVAEGVDLAAPLETIAALAREDLSFADEVHASFTLIRGTALTVFIFPLAFTGLYRLVAPSVVAAAYADSAGWLIAGLVAVVCLGSYRLMTASERRTARVATGTAVLVPGAEDGR